MSSAGYHDATLTHEDIAIAESIGRVALGNPSRGRPGFASIAEVEALHRVIAAARQTLARAQLAETALQPEPVAERTLV